MKIFDFLIFIIVYVIGLLFNMLSYPSSKNVGYMITRIFFFVFKRYKKIIYSNLSYAFPEEKESFYKDIYNKNLKYIGALLADSFLKPKMNGKWFNQYLLLDPKTIQIEKEIEEKLNKKEPVILISGHIGTWESLAQYLGYRFPNKTLIIYKKIKNVFLDRWLLKLRSSTGAHLYSMEETLSVIHKLEKGNLLGIAPDQNAGGNGIMINFLNRPASTYKGPILIAYKTSAHIYFICMLYDKDHKLKLFYKYLGRIKNQEKDKEKIINEWTKKWVNCLEDYVRKYPDQYFWPHQRWKTTQEILDKFQKEKLRKRGIKSGFL